MSYGVLIRSAAGAIQVDEDETLSRLVTSIVVEGDFNGTINVPEFDDTKGLFTVTFDLMKWRTSDNSQWPDDASFNIDYLHVRSNEFMFPSLLWNNSLKQLSVTQGELPNGFIPNGTPRPRYRVTFYHYR